jgi:hypothetical protein
VARAHRAEGHGLIPLASVLLLVLGCFNLIDGIAAIARSHVLIASAHDVFSDLRHGAGSPSSPGRPVGHHDRAHGSRGPGSVA